MIIENVPVAFVLLMNMTPMELFQHGDWIMWPIILLSFVALTVVIERVIFLFKESRTREPEVVEKMLELVEAGDVTKAVEIGKKSSDFIARILVYTLTHKEFSMGNAFVRASSVELARYQQGLATLDTAITAAPMLGLLGTVTGMMKTFGNMQGDDLTGAGGITKGVAEALIATAAGLFIAIVALLPFNVLNSKIEKAKHDIADAANALEIFIKKSEVNAR